MKTLSDARRQALHLALDDVLDNKPEGELEKQFDPMWALFADIAEYLDFPKSLDVEGWLAVDETPSSPLKTQQSRSTRSYAAQVLACLLYTSERLGKPSIFPNYFQELVPVLVDDLQNIRKRSGSPQILFNDGGGFKHIRRNAREIIVFNLYWRQANSGTTLVALRERFLPFMDTDNWNAWVRESGGRNCELINTARLAGEASDTTPYFYESDEKLVEICEFYAQEPSIRGEV